MLSNVEDFRALLTSSLYASSLVVTVANPVLQQILEAADRAVKDYTHRDLEQHSYTDYYDGTGLPDLPLRQRPVSTITSVKVDPNGYYGDGPDAFPVGSLLTLGTDYVLVRDEPRYAGAGKSKSGILRRARGVALSSNAFWDWPGPWMGLRKGTLTAARAPFWPFGYGNVQVVYTAGYAPGSIPADLRQAVNQLAVEMFRKGRYGYIPSSESLGEYSYSLAVQTLNSLADTKMLLANYREVATG